MVLLSLFALTYQGRWPAGETGQSARQGNAIQGQGRRRKKLTNDDPRGLAAVNRRQVLLKPVGLRILQCGERTSILALTATRLVGGDDAVAQVGLRVQLDVVDHTVVERVPEVAQSLGLRARHPEVVDVAGEVGLAGHADTLRVSDVVCFVRGTAVVTCDRLVGRGSAESQRYIQLASWLPGPTMYGFREVIGVISS
jgi:hypothetical protein